MSDGVLDTRRSAWWFLPIGLAAGLLCVLLLALPTKWMLALVAGLAILIGALTQSDLRRYFQVLLVFSIPLATLTHQFFARRDYFGVPGVGFGVVEALLVVLYAIWFLSGGADAQRVRAVALSKPSLALGAFFLAAAVSAFFALDRELAVFGLVSMAKAYLVFFYVACNLDRKGLPILVDVLLVSVLVQEVLALGQWATRSSLGLGALGESELMRMTFGGETFIRVAATLVHPNQFANYMGLLLPIALSVLISGRRSQGHNLFYGLVFVLGVVIFVLTFSRTGWVHIGLSTAIVVGLSLLQGKLRREAANFAIVGGLVGGIFLLVFSNAIYARLFNSASVLVTERFDMARVAWRMLIAHPISGVGINNYVAALPRYDYIGVMVAPVHNLYLLFGAEVGVVGLAAFVAVVVSVLASLVGGIRSPLPLVNAVAVGIVAGLVGFLADGISDFSYVLASTNLLFALLAGVAVALPLVGARGGQE